jgi:2-keto-4-pentenoate hydratase/2-oxohepta-3-ene-1,7-dioic acid hydratase in catechol pathway
VKWARALVNNAAVYGRIEGEEFVVLSDSPLVGGRPTERRVGPEGLRLLAPVEPSKIVCVGKNYAAHAAELDDAVPEEPCLFLKPPTAVIGPGEEIVYPAMAGRVDYEAELAVVIGEEARHLSPREVDDVIFGYTCLNDVTARDLQRKDVQFTRSKGFDTFCPIGPWIVDDVTVDEAQAAQVESYLNGEVKQRASADLQVFKIRTLVSFISRVMTLWPGDVIATGTPAGIGPMASGDEIEVRVSIVGSLVNHVG